MDIIIGTAGHIDHGKTALVRALTGVDTDRLPEEKKRGITIDLGFAELVLGDDRIGFVDVPGHERFIKNMLAGASGIDLVLLVVAADEGVMPQTREHFEICRLLGITAGIVILTKKDLVDDETLEVARLEVEELVAGSFLEGAPMLAVSAKSGEGIEDVKRAIPAAAPSVAARRDDLVTRLPIDRSFNVKGFGTVVTGTVASGLITETDELEILPAESVVRVRGLQSHGKTVHTVAAGQRGAVNLGGIDTAKITRGMVLAEKGTLDSTQIIDARVELLASAARPLRNRHRVRVNLGTSEVLARVLVLNFEGEIAPGKQDLVQLRLESPVVTVPGERFIIRGYSPQVTIGGGLIVDSMAAKHRRRDVGPTRRMLSGLLDPETDRAGRLALLLELAGEHGFTFSGIQARTGWRGETIRRALKTCIEKRSIVEADGCYLARAAYEDLKARTLSEIELQHKREPLARGILRETLREKVFARISPGIFRSLMRNLEADNGIVSEKDSVRLPKYDVVLSPDEAEVQRRIKDVYRTAGLAVPKLNDLLSNAVEGTKVRPEAARKVFQLFLDSGELVKISDEFYFPRQAIDEITQKIRTAAASRTDRSIDVSAFKELTGLSRKYAIPLLEYFDRERVTCRVGEKRQVL
jgi:selenocysteine-specific elongation factor